MKKSYKHADFSPEGGARRLISIGVSALLAVSTFLAVIPQTATTVYADSDKTITGLCTGAIGNPTPEDTAGLTGWKGSYVYYGKYDTDQNGTYEPMKYRVLDKAATQFGGNTMLLDCDSTIINKHFDNDSNVWANSEIRTWLNGNFFLNNDNVFTTAERTAIASSTKTSPSGDGGGWGPLDYAPLAGEKIFLLDAKEATRPSYGYANTNESDANRKKSGTATNWWLRSPHSDHDTKAGSVNTAGPIDSSHVYNDNNGVSPAFNLNLSSVIFSSAVTGGYKLTVKDENMTIAKTDGSDVTRAGNVVTVPYTISGTNSGEATQVSVLLTNSAYSAGETRTSGYSYQKLNVTTLGTSGTGTFTIPDAYKNKICGTDYHAYILAEDVNTGNATDYASIPVEITIPGKPVLTITAKDKTYPYNGEMQGPGDTTYEDPTEIAEMVTVEGLQSGDTLTSITVDGQGKDVRDYDLIPYAAVINNNISASTKYDVTYVKGTLHITSTGKSYTVTFKVKNGEWNDGKKADKTVTLSGNAGDTLKLSADQIPAVGSKPDTHCKEGSWDVTPDTKTVITSDTTYTYTYVNDGPQPEECTITFKANGGKGEMKPQSGDKGETIKLRANDFTRSGYEFRNWNTKADGSGDKYDNKQSIELTKDMTLYAQWKEKDDDDDDDDHEEEPAPKKDVRYPDGFDELRGLLSKAISDANSSGLVQTVTWNKSTSLPADVMKILHDNPNVTLVFSYTYLGTSITLTIPGSAVVLNPAVEWYGPAYLFGLYGKGETAALTTNTTVSARTYTVKSGDTLSGIAKRLKTTVKHLKDANNIKDVDKIKPGMVLKY